MADFYHFARLLLQRRLMLTLAVTFALLSAGGLGAGLLAMMPILKLLLDKNSGGLAKIVTDYNGKLPAFLQISDSTIAALPAKTFDAVLMLMIGLGILTVFGALANFLHQYCSLTLISQTVNDIRKRAFGHLVHLPLRTVLSANGGKGTADAISRVINDSAQLSVGFTALLSKALAQATKGGAAFLAALVVDIRVALVAVVAAVAIGFVISKLGKRIRKANRKALASQAGLYGAAGEALRGLRVVKVHTTEGAESDRFALHSNDMMRREFKMRTARALSSPLVELLTLIILGALALIGVKAIEDGKLDPERFIFVISMLAVAGAQIKPLTGLWNDVQQSGAAATRLRELLGLTVEMPRRSVTNSVPRLARHSESIRFENIVLTYPGASEPALRGITLDIPRGSTFAFVGPNGSGKTTLLSLVPRLFDPDTGATSGGGSGRVLIDGTDIKHVDLASLRSQIGVVTQDTVLFTGTIRSNIAYGMPAATDEQIKEAARKARCEEFILAKPGGYDFPVGEGGSGLSGGQRQRIAIARAVLRDPSILILDEATSMIDSGSEAAIAAALDEFVEEAHAGKRTCLIVAHRLSTVVHADTIVVLDHGAVIDTGTHEELIARCDVYRNIAEHQLVKLEEPVTSQTNGAAAK